MIYINNKILTSVIEFSLIKKLVIVKCKLSGFFLNYFEWESSWNFGGNKNSE